MSLVTRFMLCAVAAILLACDDNVTEVQEVEVAVIETTHGTFEIDFYPESAPLAVENFKTHTSNGYYDHVRFHRIIPGFVIQGGDPSGTGTNGESIWGKPFADEIDERLKWDRRGLVGMANHGPNTNGSQFFIALAPTPWLDGRHTIFGTVVSGMEIIDAIEKVGSETGVPSEEVRIKKAHLLKRPPTSR
jgi:peptidylprolyl isomerase